MLKNYCFALLILISGFVNADDRQIAFKRAIDYSNCKIAAAYCKQYATMKPESKERKSYDKISVLFNCKIGQSSSFDSINDILSKNDFKAFSSKSSVVMARLSKSDITSLNKDGVVSLIVNGIYESEEFKDIFSQYTEANALKSSLTKDLNNYLSQTFVDSETDQTGNDKGTKYPNGFQSEITRLETAIQENKPGPFSPNWLSIILIVVFSGVIYIILSLKLSGLEERTDRHRKDIDSLEAKKGNFPNQNSYNTNNNFTNYKNEIENKISELNTAVWKMQNQVAMLEMKLQSKTDSQPSANQSPPGEKPQKFEILYAPIPNKDGTFNASAVSNIENPSSSFYKFTVIDSLAQKANFEFLSVERAIKDATSSPELILNPVCKIKNALNQNAKKIKTVTPGVVTKQNDKWVMTSPAEIEYE